jgi:hypothetical protein
MPRTLGALTAALVTGTALALTAGCGSSSSSIAMDPASDPAGNPSSTPGPVEGAQVLPLISMTGIGGQASTTAAPLNSAGDITRFVRQFPSPLTQKRLRSAIVAAPSTPGHDLVGQVVAIGCDRPPGVTVMVNKDGRVELVPHEVASPLPECLAAVTTIAIALLPRS